MTDLEIYLDYAAATPVDERVIDAMRPYFGEKFFNPSSPYAPAVQVGREYEEAKSEIAQFIGGKGIELIMTAGATESINLAFKAINGHVIVSAIEHAAVLSSAKQFDHTIVSVNEQGRVNIDEIIKSIRDDTELISIGLANNELGTIQPLREISEIVKAERKNRLEKGNKRPIYFHSDASQGLGVLDINTARLGVDMLTINAAKVYGPKQVGALWASSRVELQPVLFGGGQERNLRSGTENVAGTIGFMKAMKIAEKERKNEAVRQAALRDKLQKNLLEAFPGAVVSGSKKHRLANFLHISFPDIDAERIIFILESKRIYLATGSACAANQGTRSHVLTAIGLPSNIADGSLRITLGRYTTGEMIDLASDEIINAINSEYKRKFAA